MRILTEECARELVKGKNLENFISDLSNQLQPVGGTYSTPDNSGRQIALSRLVAYLLIRRAPICLYITAWSVWTENLDLFYGYRNSLGEKRLLMEAPVHVFEQADEDAFVSLLCMVFFFFWDAWIFDFAGEYLVRLSHDGWFEVRAREEGPFKEIVAELQKYEVSLLENSGKRNARADGT